MTRGARRTAVVVLLAVFLVGGAAGWVLEEVLEEMDWPGATVGDGDGDDGGRHEVPDDDAEEDFLETLGLTRSQLDSVDRLLDEREDRLEAYWSARLPDLRALIDSSRMGIRALLNEEQRAAYDRWLRGQRELDD
ncbi:MAG TPA: hypothetical protein VFZ26_07010 [Gemmatimonadales bacterium]